MYFTRNHFNGRACGLLIAGAFVLLVTLFFAFRTPPPIETQSVEVIEVPLPRRVRLTSPPVFDSEAFYRTIIENNLFRPLGWTPPRPIEPYRLLGTILPRDGNTPPRRSPNPPQETPHTSSLPVINLTQKPKSLTSGPSR